MLKVQATVGVDLTERFETLSQLGKGSYGTVYKARDKNTGELVAIKVVNYDESGDAEGDLSVVAQEIQMLADCNHPNIVRYQGSYRHGKSLWIVMEHCGGGSVSDLIQAMGSNLTEDQVAYICGEALEGLAYLHNLGKVHRDIKCGNILLTDTGEVKLADFGVAAQLTKTMSKRNTFIGTPHWMAPEVIQESRYDGKVDLWALGISAIEMAEKLPPRWGVHALRVIFMISREPPPQLKDQSKWSPVFHDFIAKCLVKDPQARPTARLMLQHRFVAQIRPEARQSLLPLIAQAQQSKPSPALAISPTQAAANTTSTAATNVTAQATPLTYKEGSMFGGHGTVRTSIQFRSKKTLPGNNRTMLSPTSPWPQAGTRGTQGHSDTSGTLVVKEGPASIPPSPALLTPNRPGDYKFGGIVPSPMPRSTPATKPSWNQAGTMVVNSNTMVGGSGGMGIDEGDESDEDEEEGSYMAALRAAAKDSGGYGPSRKGTSTAADSTSDYMAAVQSAAREPTPRGATPHTAPNQSFPSVRASDAASSGTEDYLAAIKSAGQGTVRRPQSGARSQPAEENWRQIKHSKLIEKLQALHEGGLIPVVPVLAAGIVPPLSQLRPLGPPTAVREYQDMEALVNCLPEQLQATMAFSHSQTAHSVEKPFSAKQVMSTMLQQHPAMAKLAAALSYQHQCQRLPDSNPASKDALARAMEESCDTLSYFLCT